MTSVLSRIKNLFLGRNKVSNNISFIEGQFEIRTKDSTQYDLALMHRSNATAQDNERLELLGDAVLDLIVADYIFQRFPEMDEGFLTKLKSKFISRENLIEIARKEGLSTELDIAKQKDLDQDLIIGNVLEALFGAMYLDQGYEISRDRAIQMFERSSPVEGLLNDLHDPKSQLLEWAQKNKIQVRFAIDAKGRARFETRLYLDEELVAKGSGRSKKNSEKEAARRAIEELKIEQD